MNSADPPSAEVQAGSAESSSYTAIPTSVSSIALAGYDGLEPMSCPSCQVAGSLYTLLLRYGTGDNSKPPEWQPTAHAFATDASYGTYYPFKIRFMNALHGQASVALTLQHGRQNLPLSRAVDAALVAPSMRRTSLAGANCFADPGAWLQAWTGTDKRAQVPLATHPAEQIKPNSCPPHCPLAAGSPIVAPTLSKPQTVILGNDTTSSPPFLVAVEDDDAVPKLCTARVRLISLLGATMSATAKRGEVEHPLSSPALSPTTTDWGLATELPGGAWSITVSGGSPKSRCAPTLHNGRCYSLYVWSAAQDEDGLPIYSCRLEVDSNYESTGYVRLAHAAGNNSEYSMTVQYTEGDETAGHCVTPMRFPTSGVIRFGEQSGYKPLQVYGTTNYQVTVHQSAGDASPAEPTTKSFALTAGKNWTIYVLPPRDATASVTLWLIEDGTKASWSGRDDEVGLRWLDGLPGGSPSSPWKWKHCDKVGGDCAEGEGSLAPYPAPGSSSADPRYQTAAIHGYVGLPTQRWRVALQAERGAEKATAEFGEEYSKVTSADDGTTVMPLTTGSMYTVVLTEAGGQRGDSSLDLLMFQDQDGEPHGWWSKYTLLFALVLGTLLVALVFIAWCGSKWTSGSKWSLRKQKCCRWCRGLCGRDGGGGELAEPLAPDSAEEAGSE